MYGVIITSNEWGSKLPPLGTYALYREQLTTPLCIRAVTTGSVQVYGGCLAVVVKDFTRWGKSLMCEEAKEILKTCRESWSVQSPLSDWILFSYDERKCQVYSSLSFILCFLFNSRFEILFPCIYLYFLIYIHSFSIFRLTTFMQSLLRKSINIFFFSETKTRLSLLQVMKK